MKPEQSSDRSPEAVDRDFVFDPATRRRLGELVQDAIDNDRRARRRVFGRRVATALSGLLLVGTGLWASTALATGSNCATGLICFSAGDPAVADDVNQNFKTLKGWLDTLTGNVETKIGPLNTSSVETDEVVVRVPNNPWAVTIGDQTANGIHGFNFHNNPGGGTGDNAWISYTRDGATGEDTALEIGISDDINDDLRLVQGGASRLEIAGGNVTVRNSLTVIQDQQINRDLQVDRNLNVDGQITGSLGQSACTWRSTGTDFSSDDQWHEVTCNPGEYMAGMKCYATTYIDGGCHAKCCTP